MEKKKIQVKFSRLKISYPLAQFQSKFAFKIKILIYRNRIFKMKIFLNKTSKISSFVGI